MNHEDDMETVQQQAERWFARLRGEGCSTAERRAFDVWLAADAVHALAYAQTERLWNELGVLRNDVELKRARHVARRAAQSSMRRAARRRRLALAASFVLALIAAGSLWFAGDYSAARRYATAHGEQRTLILADGSRVMLNTDSMLDVKLGTGVRSVHLIKGEALFDVVHDADHPFVVHANGNVISDLGTRFDVNESGKRTTVSVLAGSVNVERGHRTSQLSLGQQLVAGDGIWRRGTVDPAVVAGWSQGQLVFNATPLARAIADANRYAREQLVIADPRLEAITISGEFRIGNTQAFLRALEGAFPIRAERHGKMIHLYHR